MKSPKSEKTGIGEFWGSVCWWFLWWFLFPSSVVFYLSLRLWTLEQVIQHQVIKLMISLCTFFGFIEISCVLWDLPAFSRLETEGSSIP